MFHFVPFVSRPLATAENAVALGGHPARRPGTIDPTMPSRPAAPQTVSRPRRWRWALLVVAAVAVVFGRSVGFDFVTFDDDDYLVHDRFMNPFTAHSLAAFWSAPYEAMYTPATYTAWGVLTFLARVPRLTPGGPTLDPAVFHCAGVAIHAANAAVVWLVLRRLVASNAAAVFGALVFALHPVQVEPVVWVSGFNNTFSGFWSLLAVLLFLRSAVRRGRPAWGGYAAATAACGLAMLSKPAAVVVPALTAVLAWAAGDPRPRRTLLLLAPWLLFAVPIIRITGGQQDQATLMTWNPPAVRPLVAADAMAFYLRQIVWPASLAVDYGRTPGWVWGHLGRSIVGMAVVAVGLTGLLVAARGRGRAVPAGVAVLVLGLGPVLGFVPFIFQQFSTVSDRYLYLPMLGTALIAAWAVQFLSHGRAWTASLVVAALAIRSSVQVGVWRDTDALFTHNLSVNPRSSTAFGQLGLAAERAGRLADAQADDRAAIALDPSEPRHHFALYGVLTRAGDPAAGLQQKALGLETAARRVLLLDPQSPIAHRSLAEAYQLQGRPSAAAAEAAIAARLRSAGQAERAPPPGRE